MRLMLIGDDGQVIDSTDSFTREEFLAMQQSAFAALAELQGLNAGAS